VPCGTHEGVRAGRVCVTESEGHGAHCASTPTALPTHTLLRRASVRPSNEVWRRRHTRLARARASTRPAFLSGSTTLLPLLLTPLSSEPYPHQPTLPWPK
jgi:hypothetical protein